MCWGLWTGPVLQNYLGSMQVCDRCFCCGTSVFSQHLQLSISSKGKLLTDSNLCVQIQGLDPERTYQSFSLRFVPCCVWKCPVFSPHVALNSFPLPTHTIILSPSLFHGSFCLLPNFSYHISLFGGYPLHEAHVEATLRGWQTKVQKQIPTGSEDLGWTCRPCAVFTLTVFPLHVPTF